MTAGPKAEELEKRIVAALVGADFAPFLDNVNGKALKSDTLASAMTERPAQVRVIGTGKIVPLNSAAFVAVTGNGLSLSEDLARRFIAAGLDAGSEDPDARPFPGDFVEEVLAGRPELLAAALTIWRWGRSQGASLPPGRPMGSFPRWCRWCREPLVALGCADPVERVAEAKARDPLRAEVVEIFEAWWRRHQDRPVAVRELHSEVTAAADPDGRGRQYLATRIRGLEGTRLGGFVLHRRPGTDKWSADTYRLRSTGSAEASAQEP
jgi:hypothetical protein